ncbi:hypothetical protein MKX78_03790 [Cytobacillus sp. FSL R5-0569]|uniref:hypothetical protein n=1 Tax=Cytobacillus TaxID=2675230 RepID=UPI002789ACA2|nr:hypothetical protein [Cytobacillus kochii]MDQ0185246.1 hypothetical protein [Cytobacillus kochii]
MLSTALSNLDLGAKGLWFPIIVVVALLFILNLMPKKRINRTELYIIFCIVGFATWIMDAFILRVFDLVDLGSPKKLGLGDILSFTFIPSSLACIFLNFSNKKNKWSLVIFFTLISFGIEIGIEYFGYMIEKGWFNFFSILFYFIVYGFVLPYQLRIIRRR